MLDINLCQFIGNKLISSIGHTKRETKAIVDNLLGVYHTLSLRAYTPRQ